LGAREAGLSVVMATQGLSDLEAVDRALVHQVLQDTAWQLVFRQGSQRDAELLQGLFGEAWVEDLTRCSDGRTASRQVERPQLVNTAGEILREPMARARYDALRAAPGLERARTLHPASRGDATQARSGAVESWSSNWQPPRRAGGSSPSRCSGWRARWAVVPGDGHRQAALWGSCWGWCC
jgi:hypothetical protein